MKTRFTFLGELRWKNYLSRKYWEQQLKHEELIGIYYKEEKITQSHVYQFFSPFLNKKNVSQTWKVAKLTKITPMKLWQIDEKVDV